MTEREDSATLWQAYCRYSGAGVQLVVTTMLGVWVGRYVDMKLATRPVFLVMGGLLGMGLGFYSVYKLLKLSAKKEKKF